LNSLKKEEFIPSLALKMLSEGFAEILKYNGVSRTGQVVQAALQRYEEEEIRAGVVQ
jgi:hypothetical protein